MSRTLAFCLTCSAAKVIAAEPSDELDIIAAATPGGASGEIGWKAEHATGDWAGFRTQLLDRGVHLYAGYTAEVLGNISGGVRTGAIYEGLLELGLDLHPERFGLWKNGLLRVTSLLPHGPSISRYTGDILTVSNIDAYDSFRLYELWYEHQLLDQRLSIRFGQLVADDEFAVILTRDAFLNSSFGWPAFVSGNVVNTGPAYFVATPGLRLRYAPSETIDFQAAVYDGDSFDSPEGDPSVNASGTRVHFSHDQGLLAMGEVGLHFNVSTNSQGLPGHYKLGGWVHTADFPSNYEPDRAYSSNFGLYAALEQMVWRNESEKIWIFARAGIAPRDHSFFELTIDLGVAGRGLLPGRAEDIAAIGFAYARISRDIRAFEQWDANANGTTYDAFSDYESVLEASYIIQLNKWWTIQPDFQWIMNPGGNNALADAVVLGVRTSIIF